MNLKRALEKNGFKVERMSDGWFISQYTPAGEDWGLTFSPLKEFIEYAEEYDPEQDFGVWMEAKYHGTKGIPEPSELWKDQLWKQETLKKVLEDIK